VHVVRRDDRNNFDSISAVGFTRNERLDGRINAIGSEGECNARTLALLRIRGWDGRNKLIPSIDSGSHAMYGADERAFSATDHSPTQRTAHVRPPVRKATNVSHTLHATIAVQKLIVISLHCGRARRYVTPRVTLRFDIEHITL
jgi:hypothetical protein